MYGTFVHAPVINPKQIIDVGCGTGVVTCYLGERFPNAQVWGIDISPVPTYHDKPNKVTFVQGGFQTLASTDVRFAQGSTDLVFSRLLICGMIGWKTYVETSVSTLKPGGYLDIQEIESRWYIEEEEVGQGWGWWKAYYAALQANRLDPDCAEKIEGWMRDAGMKTVQVKKFSWPFTKEQKYAYQRMLPRILAGQGHSEEKVEAMVGEVMRTVNVEGLYKKFWVILGQKGR